MAARWPEIGQPAKRNASDLALQPGGCTQGARAVGLQQTCLSRQRAALCPRARS